MNTVERSAAVIQDLRWILRTCGVTSVLPVETFKQALTLTGVAQIQTVRDGCAEIKRCIAKERYADNHMCAEYLETALMLVSDV